jgi:hypothetical protein
MTARAGVNLAYYLMREPLTSEGREMVDDALMSDEDRQQLARAARIAHAQGLAGG